MFRPIKHINLTNVRGLLICDVMIYKDIEPLLMGMHRAGYRCAGIIYGPQSDVHFFTEGHRVVILENRGRVLGMTVYHSSTLTGVDEELRRIHAHHPNQFKLTS